MLPHGSVHDITGDITTLQAHQKTGRGLVRQGDAGGASEERSVDLCSSVWFMFSSRLIAL